MKEIHIFAGHYGSGKTELSINFALEKKKTFDRVVVIDIDTVNPYFRANDVSDMLQRQGIEVIAGKFASSGADLPVVPADVLAAFAGDEGCFIFDVGGDDDGAYALGIYADKFKSCGYNMHLVANTRRPLTKTADELYNMACAIEKASKLKFTDIFNNTNILSDTDMSIVMSGREEVQKLAKMMGIEVIFNCGLAQAVEYADENSALCIKRYLELPW